MAVTDNRPFFLNLLKIRLPVTGFVSILHRVSGMLLFLSIPFMIYLFDLSLQSEKGFMLTREILGMPLVQLILLVLLWSIIHHFIAGIRFLMTDFDIGLDKKQSIVYAWGVFIVEALVFIAFVVGVFL